MLHSAASPATQLSSPQLQAVEHLQGPVVVFAGAGSGKTRVIVHRIVRLIEDHRVPPHSICALTFTHKAAQEMKQRALALSPSCGYAQISTFHSAAARWLREFAPHLGFTGQFSILDTKESESVLKSILKHLPPPGGEEAEEDGASSYCLNTYRDCLGKLKTQALHPDLPYTAAYCQEFGPFAMLKIYREYQRVLKERNSMDFSDLLLHMLTLLRTKPEVKQKLQQRYSYLLVDEYQDVNPTQSELTSHLSAPPHNLMVVGDDDQSIYSWRGADPQNILNFQKTYPDAQIIRLEQNYRSTGHIIQSANALILNNKVRAPKNLWTKSPLGEPLHLLESYNGSHEAEMVCYLIKEEIRRYPYHHIAIFYRTNAQSREIEDQLVSHRIPYKIYGSLRFYDRTEIKDLLAYFRLAVNPKDDVALLRILKAPPRGLGIKALEAYNGLASGQGWSLYEAFAFAAQNPQDPRAKQIPRRAFRLATQTYEQLSALYTDILKDPLDQAVSHLLAHVGYLEHLKKAYPDQVTDKIDNVQELAAAMNAYHEQNPKDSLGEWLQNVSLLGSEKEEVQGVSLMTLHCAKGLEFPRVYLMGCDDGLLPHSNSQDDPLALEEERRLMYVGITRAQKKITLTTAQTRRVYYDWRTYSPSRFLDELPTEHLITPKAPSLYELSKTHA